MHVNYPPDPLEVTRARRAADKARFEALPPDKCMLCEVEGPDMRGLYVSCGYAVHEAVPEMIDTWLVKEPVGVPFWYLRICKSCRGAFLQHLATWADERKQRRGLEMTTDGGDY